MKKLILLALVAAGIGVVVKSKSEQIKSGAAKVTSDPRVQSALATASERTAPLKEKAAPYAEAVKEKAAPVAETVKERLHKGDDLTPPAVPAEAEEVAVTDPVSAPEFSGDESVAPEPTPAPGRPAPTGDPLTDPLPPEDTRG